MKKRFLGLSLLFVLSALGVFAQETAPVLTHEQFKQKVAAYYPCLKTQNEDVAAALAGKLMATAGFLPYVSGSLSITRGDDPVYVFGSLLRQERFTAANFAMGSLNSPRSYTDYNASLQGRFLLFNAFQTISRIKQARLQAGAAADMQSFVADEAVLVASTAYMNAVALEKFLADIEKVCAAAAEDIKQAQELKDKGLILGADYYAAHAIFNGLNQMKNRLTREKAAMHVVMNILMGAGAENDFRLEDGFAVMPAQSRSLSDWLAAAYQKRRDLRAVEAGRAAARIDAKREKASCLPVVSAFIAATKDANKLSANGGDNYIAGLRAEMSLFDPQYPARVQLAHAMSNKKEQEYNAMRDKVAGDVNSEFSTYSALRDNQEYVRQIYSDMSQAVDLVLPLYREGKKSIADLLEMRLAYVNAARNYYFLESELNSARLNLAFAAGELEEVK